MDIYCVVCSEPWDMDTIHDFVAERFPTEPWVVNGKHDQEKYEVYYDKVKQQFFKSGCEAFDCTHSKYEYEGSKAKIAKELYNEFGDDLDGIASIMEDMFY